MRIAFIALALSALVLGYVGLADYLSSQAEFGTGVLDLFYWDLQLFVLDSAPLQAGGDLPLTLQIARFAAPAATLSALFATAHAVLQSQITLVRTRYLTRNHTIICGAGPQLTFLARQLVEQGRRVVSISADGQLDSSVSGLPSRVMRISGDPRDAAVLHAAGIKRAREIMALTADSAFNGEVAVTVRTLAETIIRSNLMCFAEVADPDLCAELTARALGAGRSTRVQPVFFSRYDRASRRLLDRYPVAPADGATPITSTGHTAQRNRGNDVAVVVVGDGQFKDAMVKEIRRRWTHVTSPGDDAVPMVVKAPGDVFDANASAELEVDVGAEESRAPTHVFVCLDDDATAIRTGLRVSRLLASDLRHLVVATPVSTVFGRELGVEPAGPGSSGPIGWRSREGRLTLHNVTETVYAPEAVRRGDVEDIARAAHDAYVAAARDRGETPTTNESMVPWDELPEFKKDDNRDQAADIGRKLSAIGAAVVPASDHDGARFTFESNEIELLAHMEHERWVRRRREHGWSHGEVKDERAKQHPDMVGWDELTAASKEKDRLAVSEIPVHLRAAGFAIVRGVD